MVDQVKEGPIEDQVKDQEMDQREFTKNQAIENLVKEDQKESLKEKVLIEKINQHVLELLRKEEINNLKHFLIL